ncbi:MAG TPA: aquaporin, partial [Desertimonas sp.]|nr:aquaporin [Desertimonas sp.]
MNERMRIALVEAFGTGFLVLGGCGTAVLAGGVVGNLGVSFAFGLSLLVMVYTIGPITGCHINPAVTLGLMVVGRTKKEDVPYYIVGQVVGGLIAGLILFAIANGIDGFDATNNFAANGWGEFSPSAVPPLEGYNLAATIITEIVMTAFLLVAIVASFHRKFSVGFAGVSIGLVLTLVHLISIPVDNTSVNPARSIAVAPFAGSDALQQLWVFIVFPI